jgi:hypothetical protein
MLLCSVSNDVKIYLYGLVFVTYGTLSVAVYRCVECYSQARVVSRALWSEAEWLGWCGELRGGGRCVGKACIPLVVQRAAEVDAVKAWVRKRPAAATKRPAASPHGTRHRTPY